MKRILLCFGLAALAAAAPLRAQTGEFAFGVINNAQRQPLDEAALRGALAESDDGNLAFVVANGIKSGTEPCSDALYARRKAILERAKNGLIVSLAGSDWSGCRGAYDRPAAVERLNRLRELFFVDEFSFGAAKIPLVRQSNVAKFRGYGENARWEVGSIMFATVNLPADNNHYRTDAGRNGEFEDRLIANRDWLRRVFAIAARRKMGGIVLFCDANPLAVPEPAAARGARRDGFAEMRQQIGALAVRFPGKVLLVHGQPERSGRSGRIAWHRNLGALSAPHGWLRVEVDPAAPQLFAAAEPAAPRAN